MLVARVVWYTIYSQELAKNFGSSLVYLGMRTLFQLVRFCDGDCLLEDQCLGDGGRSRVLVKVRVCLKNFVMVLISFRGFFVFFIRFPRLNEHCPKLYCLILEKATQSVRMCVAVSSSSLSSQCAQCGSSASFILYCVCMFV